MRGADGVGVLPHLVYNDVLHTTSKASKSIVECYFAARTENVGLDRLLAIINLGSKYVTGNFAANCSSNHPEEMLEAWSERQARPSSSTFLTHQVRQNTQQQTGQSDYWQKSRTCTGVQLPSNCMQMVRAVTCCWLSGMMTLFSTGSTCRSSDWKGRSRWASPEAGSTQYDSFSPDWFVILRSARGFGAGSSGSGGSAKKCGRGGLGWIGGI